MPDMMEDARRESLTTVAGTMLILIGTCALAAAAFAFWKHQKSRTSKTVTMGSMSERWLTEHRASRY
jgi:uncharacterized protein HemX